MFNGKNVALTMTTNGRQNFLEKTIKSLYDLPFYSLFDFKIIIEDSGFKDAQENVNNLCPQFYKIYHSKPMGLAKTVQDVWDMVPDYMDFIFHLEDDFLFNSVPPIYDMIDAIDSLLYLSQMVLYRQPVNIEELDAGGYMKLYDSEYSQRKKWVENRKTFSLNPCIIPRRVFASVGWPDSNEAGMTQKLNDMGFWHGVWGQKDDPPIVEHIGHYRTSWWQL